MDEFRLRRYQIAEAIYRDFDGVYSQTGYRTPIRARYRPRSAKTDSLPLEQICAWPDPLPARLLFRSRVPRHSCPSVANSCPGGEGHALAAPVIPAGHDPTIFHSCSPFPAGLAIRRARMRRTEPGSGPADQGGQDGKDRIYRHWDYGRADGGASARRRL